MNETKIIKRYQNRKLYDTHQSCYVTLEEISQMIKNADPVPVALLKEIIAKGNGSFSGYIRGHMPSEISRFESVKSELSAKDAVAESTITQ